MPSKRTPSPSDKKEAILDAMLDLVVEQGLHNAPMSAVARLSGASPGVIYHYFPSKDDLMHALYRRTAALKRQALLQGYTDSTEPRETLRNVWMNAYRFYRAHPKEMRFLDQYLSSAYCHGAEPEDSSPEAARLLKLARPRRHGGVLKDLPTEAIQSLTLGLAADLARAEKTFSTATLNRIADSVWAAVADDPTT